MGIVESARGQASPRRASRADHFCYDTRVMNAPWVIAHRGASAYAPENTLAAFRRAVELGAQFIETDLQFTRDFHWVVLHDEALDRTTNGKGRVQNHTLRQLRNLDAGSWFAPEFAGERIPTLVQVLEFSRETNVVLYLEIKSDASSGPHHGLVNALRAAKRVDDVVVISFNPANIENLLHLEPGLMTGLLFDRPFRDAVEQAGSLGARQLLPRGDRLTPELVEQAHSAGLKLVTWTLDDPAQMRYAMAAGVDGIMSNYPDRLRKTVGDV